MGDKGRNRLKTKLLAPTKQSEISKSKILFNRWRWYRILAAAVGSLSIIPGYIDYEYRYSPQRYNPVTNDSSVCVQNEISMTPRILMLIFSYTAILMLIPYRIAYLKWRTHIPRTYTELPAQKKQPLAQVIKNRQKPEWWEYLGGDTIPSIILYQILPYPGLEYTLTTTYQLHGVETHDVCYYLAEVLYVISFMRVLVFALALFYFGKYSNQVSIRQCEKYGVTPGVGFSFKCYLNEMPMFMVIAFLLIPCVFIFGSAAKVFERPLHRDGQDYDYLPNSMWNVFITMSTVGYGDQFPVTLFGRITLALSAFAGGIVLSMTFVAIGSYLNLSSDEMAVLDECDLKFAAATAIYEGYKFSCKEKKSYWDYVRLREKINQFKDIRLMGEEQDSGVNPESLEVRIKQLNGTIDDLKASVVSLSHKMDRVRNVA